MTMNRVILIVGMLSLLSVGGAFAQWVQTGLPYGSPVTAMAARDSALYAGTRTGGFYISSDGGTNWTYRNSGLPAATVNAIITVSNEVFAGTDSGIFVSSNGGASWAAADSGLTGTYAQFIYSLGLKDSSIYAGTASGLFVSTNGGAGWKPTGLLLSTRVTAITFVDSVIVVGTSGNGIYLSTDAGVTWSSEDSGLPGGNINVLVVSGTEIYAGTDYGVFVSSDSGRRWTDAEVDSARVNVTALAANGADIFAATGYGVGSPPGQTGILLSTDKGQSWKSVNHGFNSLNMTALLEAGKSVFAGTGSGLYVSTDTGSTWTEAGLDVRQSFSSGINISSIAFEQDSGQAYIFAGSGAGVYRSTDNGDSWWAVNKGFVSNPSHNPSISAVGADGGYLFAAFSGNIFRSTDKGMNWVLADSGAIPGFSQGINALAVVDSSIFAAAASVGIYRSTNEGATWDQLWSTNENLSALAVNGSDIFAGTQNNPPQDNHVFRSTNGGATWMTFDIGAAGVSSFAVLDTEMFAAMGGTVYVSSNDGAGWTMANAGLPANVTVTALAASGGDLFAGTYASGVFVSRDHGTSWHDASAGLPTSGFQSGSYLRINTIAVDSADVFAGTNGMGILRRPLDEFVTNVANGPSPLPRSIFLSQNYPNPFNPTTQIVYRISNSGFVSLKVYDVLGREVATLVNEVEGPGSYEVRFDGSHLPSGVYFYELRTGAFTSVRKFVLMK